MGSSDCAVREGGFQFGDRWLTRRGVALWLAIPERGRDEPVNGRVAAPLRPQREKARHSQLVERSVPAPPGVGDDLSDQGVEIDFPALCDASGVACAGEGGSSIGPGRSPAALATDGKAWISSPTENGRSRNFARESSGSTNETARHVASARRSSWLSSRRATESADIEEPPAAT